MPSAYRRRRWRRRRNRNRSSALGAWLFDFKIFIFLASPWFLLCVSLWHFVWVVFFCFVFPFYFYLFEFFCCSRPRHVSGTMKYCDDIAIRLFLLIGSRLTPTSPSTVSIYFYFFIIFFFYFDFIYFIHLTWYEFTAGRFVSPWSRNELITNDSGHTNTHTRTKNDLFNAGNFNSSSG